ncbi:MAG: glutamine-hydrolyzing carbamoyl-phosphate synthase small subunit [Lachnospirales bacterium]
MKKIEGKIILENGKQFKGYCFGYVDDTSVAEVVFNTAMTGYQETLTDPSYRGQFVVMTYPLVGNYGVNFDDMESSKMHMKGFIVREICEDPSNFRRELSLDGFLKENKKIGIYGVDTRALTKMIRDEGTMKAIITTRKNLMDHEIKEYFNDFNMDTVIEEVTRDKVEVLGDIKEKKTHLAVLDFGIKSNIIRELLKRDIKLTVFPAFTSAEEILNHDIDGVFLSNGPGDPTVLTSIVENIKKLIDKKPVVGICLGHQLICLAMGCDIEKLKFGHHGANHPVKDLRTGKLYITSQNHNYIATNLHSDLEEWFININDGTLEGVTHKTKPVMSVQFHPEACPGPIDSNYIFDEFLKVVKEA